MASDITGTVVGPVSDYTAGAGQGNFALTTVDYDIAIGGLPWLIAASDENPYQRQTAPFRKEQFDSQQNVGDQSIQGFWLRGQLSFHHGAGIRYYEVEEGESVIDRYFNSLGVEVATAGQAQLGYKVVANALTGTAVSMAGGYQGSTSGVFYATGSAAYFVPDAFAAPNSYSLGSAAMVAADPRPNRPGFAINGSDVWTLDATPGSKTKIYTHSTASWAGIWYGKGRLFLLDDVGNWYAQAANPSGAPVTLSGTDKFWSGVDTTSGWSTADSPGAFYMAQDRTIYMVEVDNTGQVPTLAAPITAAQLPVGETVTSLAYYLSTLIIVTNRGVRAGFVTANGITYGPQIVNFVGDGGNSIAAQDSYVYVTGRRATDSKIDVFKIDLSATTLDGAFAYAPMMELATSTGNYQGVLNCGSGTLVGVSGGSFYTLTGELSGTLETGFHRFGTLESKGFHSVSVRLDGQTGGCNVTLIEKGGVETLLASLVPSAFTDQSLLLNFDTPAEYIGLRFTITRPSTADPGPILRGYQIKALPSPERTRLLQVPLMCYDREKTRSGNEMGYDGRAWDKLEVFETMEAASTEVLYQDFRTGEQGSVFIEQSTFTNTTPPTRNSNGFGGILTVVLRRVT